MLEVAQVNFIGRKEELNTLEREFRRDGSFVVIYGRRRIGKTTLIKEFIKDILRCCRNLYGECHLTCCSDSYK